MKLRPVTASLVALTAVAVPVAGCGGGSNPDQSSAKAGGSSQSSNQSGSSPSGSSSSKSGKSSSSKSGKSSSSKPSASPAPKASSTGAVSIANFKFAPASLTVSHGARITVANHDSTAHTATADNGQSFNTGDIDPGSSATITLSKPGTYKYHCSIHPFMHGTLVVK